MTPTWRNLRLIRSVIDGIRSVPDGSTSTEVMLVEYIDLLITRGKRMAEVFHAALVYADAHRNGRPTHTEWQALHRASLKAAEMEQADAGQNGAGHDGQ